MTKNPHWEPENDAATLKLMFEKAFGPSTAADIADWEMRFPIWKEAMNRLWNDAAKLPDDQRKLFLSMLDVIDVAREGFIAGHEYRKLSGTEPAWPHVKIGQRIQRLVETLIETT